MNLRDFWNHVQAQGMGVTIRRIVDPYLEMARVIHRLEGKTTLFRHVKGSAYPVIAGVCSAREYLAMGLGVPKERLLFALAEALRHPTPPPLASDGPCREVIEPDVDLMSLPILTHLPGDGGAYVTAGIAIIKDRDYGRNASYHRLMRLDERRFAVRVVEGRGTDTAFRKVSGDLEMAVCIGNSFPVLLAAAMSPQKGVDELSIANALAPTPVVRCRTLDLEVPAEAEFILEGRLIHTLVAEGPFLDLTGKYDIIRQQPVF